MARTKRTEKLSITIPQELASEVRRLVPPGEVSAFVTQAVRESMARLRLREALDKGFGAWSDEKHPELMTPEDSIAYVNALRSADLRRIADRASGNGE